MSEELTQFIYDDHQVRVVEHEGMPWFVATDLAQVLEYRNASDLTRGLEDEDLRTHIVRTSAGHREALVVSEGGLYTILVRARTERARPFRRWVTHEVLPQIRKTGAYAADRAPQLPKSPDQLVLEAMQILTARVEESTAKIAELEPKANAWAQFLASTGDVSVNEAAKALSRNSGRVIGEHKLRRLLESKRWIYRDAKRNPRAYQVQIDRGRLAERARTYEDQKTGERVHAAPQVRITSKGLDAIRDFLSEADR
ncbi:phage antirepressor KilAC domain-containing protein [Kocuria rhizophila]|uniref:phage antirepressor KilAC domain-containing protein n=1 Tax=Kocuria rhizophila TaxID=72000 RepID=UPI00119FBF78|nr:phage antirepressor KilAC domain-containing protein [Kocuria rhizophila]MCG7425094.1 phage antirepressor KilAC domain-containing protein [Kocuria rhizophila]